MEWDRFGAVRPSRGSAVAALLIAAALIAACGPAGSRNGVATLGPSEGSAAASASPSASPGDIRQQFLAYSQCMRENGVPDFPDPMVSEGEGGEFSATIGDPSAGGMDPGSPTMQAAEKACESKLPRPDGGSAQNDPARYEQALKFAQCIREHGVPDFPDPGTSGGFKVERGGGGTNGTVPDPDSPVMQAAMKACRSLMPGGGAPGRDTKP